MPGQEIPYPYIHGLDPRQQEEIWRDFEAVIAQISSARGTLYIAPADASTWDKQHADVVLTGTDDQVALNALLDQHSADYLEYAFFEGNVYCTGTINPNAIPADWRGISRPELLSEDQDHFDAFDEVDFGTHIHFDPVTGGCSPSYGNYTSVQTIDPENITYVMFSMVQGSIRNLRLTGDDIIACVTELKHYGAFGVSVHLEDLWLANVNYVMGGGAAFHSVLRNIINITPEEGISA